MRYGFGNTGISLNYELWVYDDKNNMFIRIHLYAKLCRSMFHIRIGLRDSALVLDKYSFDMEILHDDNRSSDFNLIGEHFSRIVRGMFRIIPPNHSIKST